MHTEYSERAGDQVGDHKNGQRFVSMASVVVVVMLSLTPLLLN